MKTGRLILFAMIVIAMVGVGRSSAQFTITIPKIPRVKKTPTPPQPTDNSSGSGAQTSDGGLSSTTNTAQCPSNITLDFHADDIKKSQTEVEAYDTARGGSMVHESNDNYMLYAVSKKARDEWLSRFKSLQRGGPCDKIDPALDALAAAVAAKIGKLTPTSEDFKFRDPASEKVLMTEFKGSTTIKVHKIGLETAGWLIQKDDSGLPSYRYKDANVWFRDTSDDQPYCHLYSAVVKQDYAGGGTYSTEIYRSSAQDTMMGCPPPPVK